MDFTLAPQGVIQLPATPLIPSFGTAASLSSKPLSAPLLGDINCDFMLDFFDIAPFVSVLSSGEFQFQADINLDGVVNAFDIAPFIDILRNQLYLVAPEV